MHQKAKIISLNPREKANPKNDFTNRLFYNSLLISNII
jgi:hypothetical protein